MFFRDVSLARCEQRLKGLTDQGYLKRSRIGINCDYLYYIGKRPSHVEHNQLRVDLYILMNSKYIMYEYIPEFKFGRLRSDVYIEWQYGRMAFAAFIEIQLSSGFNQDKYEDLYNSNVWREKWSGFPLIITISNHRINFKKTRLEYIPLETDLNLNALEQYLLSFKKEAFR